MLRMVVLALATFLLSAEAIAQAGPLQHIQVGNLDRTYLLDRFHAGEASGRLPIVIFLHGLGTLGLCPSSWCKMRCS